MKKQKKKTAEGQSVCLMGQIYILYLNAFKNVYKENIGILLITMTKINQKPEITK